MMNQENNGVSRATVDNVRRTLSSFFRWLEDENYIFKSPMCRIHKIKTSVTVRKRIRMRNWNVCHAVRYD